MELSDIGLTPTKIKTLIEKADIKNLEDLVKYLPKKYYDFQQPLGLRCNQWSYIVVDIESVEAWNSGKIPVLNAKGTIVRDERFKDRPACDGVDCIYPEGEKITITWFHMNYLGPKISAYKDKRVFVAGRASWTPKYGFAITQPTHFNPVQMQDLGVEPIYKKIPRFGEEFLRETILLALKYADIKEPYPDSILAQYTNIGLMQAYKSIHMPKSMEEVEAAVWRLVQDELLFFAAANEWNSRHFPKGSSFSLVSLQVYRNLRDKMPYDLTADQASTIEGLISLAKDGRRINALVQGDVGCGKSSIAILLMAAFAGNGYQAVLMAPTQVLAKQHFNDMESYFGPMGIQCAYLGTDLKAAERRKILAQIASGEVKIIIGTTSVIGQDVIYQNLAVAITDEEHKFGVAQRKALIEKAAAGIHTLTMSATPIPRSLAEVVYGDAVQLFNIKTMPAGRKPVKTGIATDMDKLFRFIAKEARAGHQTYVVCPVIDKSDSETMKEVWSVSQVSSEFSKALAPYGVKVETLTGRDSKMKMNEVLERFKSGETNVLVSTSIIEVGVNIKTATMMVIVDADRFGLASLHQLRGRVGRSDLQSFCVLVAPHANEKGMERLQVLVNCQDGFDIAKEDLRLRGAGDLIGTQQSGNNKLFSLMLTYPEEYASMKEIAKNLVDQGWEIS